MGVIELEFGSILQEAIKQNKIEPLLRKMALIIDRQAIALGSLEFHQHSIIKAASAHEQLFKELKELSSGSIVNEVRPDSDIKG